MTDKTLKELAEDALRNALENGSVAEQLNAVQYVLARPAADKGVASKSEPQSAQLIVHLDSEGNLKQPPYESANEATAEPYDAANWTELHADGD